MTTFDLEPAERWTVIDPVCGMQLDPARSNGKSTGSHTVHFCCAECRRKYDAEPQRFAKKRTFFSFAWISKRAVTVCVVVKSRKA